VGDLYLESILDLSFCVFFFFLVAVFLGCSSLFVLKIAVLDFSAVFSALVLGIFLWVTLST